MSFKVTIAPFSALMGRKFMASTVVGLLLSATWYSRLPIFAVPVGRIRFC